MIFDEIARAIETELYYAALSMTLSLPDICSSLELEEGHARLRKNAVRYQGWFDKYARPKFSAVNANDCWALRGGVLHNAMLSKHPKNNRGRIAFMLPSKDGGIIEEMTVERCGPNNDINAIQVYLPTFCSRLMEAVKDWWSEKESDTIVQRNLPDLVRYRPRGMMEIFSGVRMIA